MLARRIRKQMRRLERLGVSVSPEHAHRSLMKQRRKVRSEEKDDDEY